MKKLKCINNQPLPGNEVAPPLEVGKVYDLVRTTQDKNYNDHYDVGLVSKYSYVRSIETGETLDQSGEGGIHWCHPSRFVNYKTLDETIQDAKRLKGGKRVLTGELTAIELMFEDDNYQMYVNEFGYISFKLKEEPNNEK